VFLGRRLRLETGQQKLNDFLARGQSWRVADRFIPL
jgi:hypothetical protein